MTPKMEKIRKEYDREMLRSAFASVFWSVISERRKGGYTLKALADSLRIHKSAVSRWFSGKSPNWEVNTIADLAAVLDINIHITATDRYSGKVFTASGPLDASSGPTVMTMSGMVLDPMNRNVDVRTAGNVVPYRTGASRV